MNAVPLATSSSPDARSDRAPDGPTSWSAPVLPAGRMPYVGPWDPQAHRRPVNARLLAAIERYDLADAVAALRAGADPNVRSWGGNVVLRLALKPPDNRPSRPRHDGWDPRLVRVLLEAGADPQVVCQQGTTVALMAWQYSHNAPAAMAATTWLVEHPGTDVTHANHNGNSMISMASYAPNLLATLVARGENPNRTCETTTALGAALRWGPMNSREVVRAFIDAGADPNAHPEGGRPALPFLLGPATRVSPAIVQELLAVGADPYWRSPSGATLDDLIVTHAARDHLMDLLAAARYRADNRRLNQEWRTSIGAAHALPVRPRSRL